MQHKINIFALPAQTTVLFIIIVTVVIGALILGSIGSSPVLIWPVALLIVILSLRSFISQPEKKLIKCYKADSHFPYLKQGIEHYSHKLGLKYFPQLYISSTEKNADVYVLGSFCRKYIVMTEKAARKWEKQLSHSHEKAVAQAGIIHELTHLKNGDDWKLGYARELLRVTFGVMLWATLFYSGLTVLLMVSLPDIVNYDFSIVSKKLEEQMPVPTELSDLFLTKMDLLKATIRNKMGKINFKLVLHFIVNSFLPFISIGSILWLFYLRKLRRTREFYADARVINIQKEIKPIYCLLSKIPISYLKKEITTQAFYPKGIKQRVKDLLHNHPNFNRRAHAWLHPEFIFDDGVDTAILIAIFSIIMDIILLSPFSILYFAEIPMHFSMLASLILIAIRLIPNIATGKPVTKELFIMIGLFTLTRFIITFLIVFHFVFLFIFAPKYLSDMLSTAVASFARYAGSSTKGLHVNILEFIYQALYYNIPQPLIISTVSFVCLIGIILMMKRILRWYNFPTKDNNVMGVLYLFIFSMCLVAASMLKVITSAFFNTPMNLFFWGTLFAIAICIGIVMLVCDRIYVGKCPNPKCNQYNSGHYFLGKICQNCKTPFHSWLMV